MLELIKSGKEGDDFPKSPVVTRLTAKDTSRRTEEELAKERQRADREIDKIAVAYADAQGNKEKLTELNDQLLRLILRLNPDVTASDVIFTKLRTQISQIENDRKNIGDLQRERERADNIHKSITQLAPFIRSELARNPDLVFASSTKLDEKRGVDLLLCQPTWNPERQILILDIELIQAKSGVTDADEIRRLGRVYQSTRELMLREFVLSESWFSALAKEISTPESERTVEVLFEHLDKKRALVELFEAPIKNQKLAVFREFQRAFEIFEQMREVIEQFGGEQIYSPPKIELRKFGFFILVETKNGKKYLSADEAASYNE